MRLKPILLLPPLGFPTIRNGWYIPWFSAFKSYTVSLIGYVIALDYQLCPLGETLGSSRAFKTHTVLLVSMV